MKKKPNPRLMKGKKEVNFQDDFDFASISGKKKPKMNTNHHPKRLRPHELSDDDDF